MNDEFVDTDPFADLRLPQSKGRHEVIPAEERLVELADAPITVHGPEYGPEVRSTRGGRRRLRRTPAPA